MKFVQKGLISRRYQRGRPAAVMELNDDYSLMSDIMGLASSIYLF
jgi:hypothetical protein